MSSPVASKLGITDELYQTGDPTKLINMSDLRPVDHMFPGTASVDHSVTPQSHKAGHPSKPSLTDELLL